MPRKKAETRRADPTRAISKGRPKAVKAPVKSAGGAVYQLKIMLNDIRPPIWRRVQTRDWTLAKLHDLIQISMGWFNSHLHLFKIGEDHYGDRGQWPKDYLDELEKLDERKLKLSQLAEQGVKRFHYEYDMGDGWRHTIIVEKTVSVEAGVKYPRCVGGERACPPEDCGGPWGYGAFVEAVSNPKHKQHEELLEWVGGEFDPEMFDVEAVNKELQAIR